MSATSPLTPEQIINIVNKAMERKGDLHARITVARKVTVPGQTEYSSEGVTFGIEVDVPHGENLIDATRRVKADLEVLVGEFKAAHLIKRSSEKGTQVPKTEPQAPKTDRELVEERYGVDEIECLFTLPLNQLLLAKILNTHFGFLLKMRVNSLFIQ